MTTDSLKPGGIGWRPSWRQAGSPIKRCRKRRRSSGEPCSRRNNSSSNRAPFASLCIGRGLRVGGAACPPRAAALWGPGPSRSRRDARHAAVGGAALTFLPGRHTVRPPARRRPRRARRGKDSLAEGSRPMTATHGSEVPLCDLLAQYRELRPQLEEALARVLASGQVILGPEVAALEREVAHYCGV